MTMGDGPATDGTGNDSNLGDLVRTVVDDALGTADAAQPLTVSGFAGSGPSTHRDVSDSVRTFCDGFNTALTARTGDNAGPARPPTPGVRRYRTPPGAILPATRLGKRA
jgi:hypothetical protein